MWFVSWHRSPAPFACLDLAREFTCEGEEKSGESQFRNAEESQLCSEKQLCSAGYLVDTSSIVSASISGTLASFNSAHGC